MRVIGVLTVLAGWAITIAGILITPSNTVRIITSCIGIGVSVYGIFGVLNGYYQERAIWKK